MASKKPAAPSSDATSSSNKPVKRVLPPAPSRVPVTIDVPLEEVSSAPLPLTAAAGNDSLLSLASQLVPDSKIPTRREITTLDVATVMPSTKSSAPSARQESPSSSSSPTKKKKKSDAKKTENAEATSSQATSSENKHFIGTNYTPKQLWDILPTEDLPRMKLREDKSKAKGLIAPEEFYPIYAILALNEQIKTEMKQGPAGTTIPITTYGKLFMPHANMSVSYKFTIGSSNSLKEKIRFEDYSKREEIKLLQKILRIKTTQDFFKIPSNLLQKARLDIEDLTVQLFYDTRLRVLFDSEERRAEGMATLGENVQSNFGLYSFFENGKRIPDLQVQLEFSTLKLIEE